MTFKRLGLAVAGLLCISTIAYAGGLWPDLPVVGGASYCAGSSSSATGTIIGLVTGCPNTVPAGPSILTGNEQIPADTRLGSGAAPQSVLIPMASLNALPITVATALTAFQNSITAANNSGGVVLTASGTISSANVVLPPGPIDGQQYAISADHTITTFSVAAGAGSTLAATTPTVLTASTTAPQGYRWVYNLASLKWFRLQ